jgi:hypothetical protein
MLAASLIGVFFVPVIFYVVEKLSGAGKERVAAIRTPTTVHAEGD